MGLHVRNIEMFSITEKNDREVIVSDFSQLINQYDDNDMIALIEKIKIHLYQEGAVGEEKALLNLKKLWKL
jgi:hypothetical protein